MIEELFDGYPDLMNKFKQFLPDDPFTPVPPPTEEPENHQEVTYATAYSKPLSLDKSTRPQWDL